MLFANLLLKNAAAATVTFKPRAVINGWWNWILDLGGPALANPVVTNKSTVPKSADGTTVHEWFITRPRVDAPSGAPGTYTPAPRIVGRNKAKLTTETSGTSSTAEREELYANLVALVLDPGFKAMIVDNDMVRG